MKFSKLLVAVLVMSGCAKRPAPEPMYSIWLSPSGADYARLQIIVDDLADKYSLHKFMPHATLAGDIGGPLERVEKMARLIAELTPAESVDITGVEWTAKDEWRSFYLRMEQTPGMDQLLWRTYKVTGVHHDPPYHISLMYTHAMTIDERWELRDHLVGSLPTSIVMDRIRVCTAGDVPEDWTCPLEFELK